MKLYPTLNVQITYQNFGTGSWVLILRGNETEIEQAFNGLYNWGVTNGTLSYFDHNNTIALVWTTPERLHNFFWRREILHMADRPKTILPNRQRKVRGSKQNQAAHMTASAFMGELRTHHEFFFNFADAMGPEIATTGKIVAERPDTDMKDAIINHAYAYQASD